MKPSRMLVAVTMAASVLAAPVVFAQENDVMQGRWWHGMDVNKDSMVTRTEFLNRMGAIYDAMNKKMGSEGIPMSQIDQIPKERMILDAQSR